MKKSVFVAGVLMSLLVLSCDKNSREKGPESFKMATMSTFVVDGANNGGNITCDEVSSTTGCEFEFSSGRLDYEDFPAGGTTGPITWTTDGKYVSWSSTVPVKVAIIVKGGPAAQVYFEGCDECVQKGSGLSAPINPNNGKPYGLSNITFCYSICETDDKCETAFAAKTVPSYVYCFLDLDLDEDGKMDFNRWGWTNGPVRDGSSWYFLYAGAGQCDITKGTKVGVMNVIYNAGTATVYIDMDSPYTLKETHLYIGNDMLPMNNGKYTVAPGQYPYKHEDLVAADKDKYVITGLSGGLYIILHATVCGF
jgi:hypothetical protein